MVCYDLNVVFTAELAENAERFQQKVKRKINSAASASRA